MFTFLSYLKYVVLSESVTDIKQENSKQTSQKFNEMELFAIRILDNENIP